MGKTKIDELSYRFALRIVKLNEDLHQQRHFLLGRQILGSGTAIGALVSEAQYAQSRADFINKMQIALKEASETRYWLHLLYDSGYLDATLFESLIKDLESLIRILTKIITTSKKRQT